MFESSVRAARVAIVLLPSLLAAWRGAGGGVSRRGPAHAAVRLPDVKYGRRVDDGVMERLVSPLTTATIDPISGLLVAGTLQPLAPGVDVNAPQTVALGTDYLPRVIPRNGVLELDFSMPIDPASV